MLLFLLLDDVTAEREPTVDPIMQSTPSKRVRDDEDEDEDEDDDGPPVSSTASPFPSLLLLLLLLLNRSFLSCW